MRKRVNKKKPAQVAAKVSRKPFRPRSKGSRQTLEHDQKIRLVLDLELFRPLPTPAELAAITTTLIKIADLTAESAEGAWQLAARLEGINR